MLAGIAAMTIPRSAGAQTAVTAFLNVAVIPMDREHVLEDQTVLVRNGRIVALGKSTTIPVPAGATRIDGRGKFLMPGMADMHAHLGPNDDRASMERWLYAFAANGVTTIRVMGVNGWYHGKEVLALRARAATGAIVSPRLYVAAGHAGGGPPVRAMSEIEQAKAVGYDLLKLHGWDRPALDTMVALAHRVGLPIAGHPPLSDRQGALHRAIELGYASIEHLASFPYYLKANKGEQLPRRGGGEWWDYWMNDKLSPQDVWHLLADSAKLRVIAGELRQARVWTCPTLAMYEAILGDADTWPEMRYIAEETLQRWRNGLTTRNVETKPSIQATAEAAVEVRGAVVKALHEAGVGLLLGTDAGVRYMLPGFAVHRELEALVRAGLSPYEALVTGTRDVAAYFGTRDSTGTVAVGQRADLVLLSGNPLDEIRHTMHPAGVMLNGRWLDRTELDRGLEALLRIRLQ